jgi:uncharacterized membrane protein
VVPGYLITLQVSFREVSGSEWIIYLIYILIVRAGNLCYGLVGYVIKGGLFK